MRLSYETGLHSVLTFKKKKNTRAIFKIITFRFIQNIAQQYFLQCLYMHKVVSIRLALIGSGSILYLSIYIIMLCNVPLVSIIFYAANIGIYLVLPDCANRPHTQVEYQFRTYTHRVRPFGYTTYAYTYMQ